jgi:nucleolar protein 16
MLPSRLFTSLSTVLTLRIRNKEETMTQNYRRLGLVARLNGATGGSEKKLHQTKAECQPLKIQSSEASIVTEARVERDADGNITRVISGKKSRPNPLGDLLNEFDNDSDEDMGQDEPEGDYQDEWGGIEDKDGEEATDVVKQLEAEAAVPEEKAQRHQPDREREWLARLVERHGDDIQAMVWDRKLNPMQQTAGDIRRRLKMFKEEI